MLPGNYEGKSVCMRGTSFRDIVVEQSVRCCGCASHAAVSALRASEPFCSGSGVVAMRGCLRQGWDWTDEGRSGRHKWGYVSWTPGARLVLQVNGLQRRKPGQEQRIALAWLWAKLGATHCTIAR